MIALRSRDGLYLSLFVATVTLIALPVAFASSSHPSWTQFVVVVGIMGNAHVGMTAFFCIGDDRYKPILARQPWRYVWLPLIAMTGAIALFLYSEKGFWLYFMIHYAWLLWHFGRQNFGIYSFVAVGNRSGRVSQLERWYFALIPVAGILKAWTLYPQIGMTGDIVPILRVAAWAAFAGAVAMLCAILYLYPSVRSDWQRLVALVLGAIFFAPTLAFDNPAVALTFFAHSAQYIIMMLYLAGDRKQGSTMLRYGALFLGAITLAGGMALLQPAFMPMYLAIAYGISQVHFLIDAGVWRLKMAPQRAIIAESFDFLFSGHRSPEPARSRPVPAE